jgi:hypothetical protein
MSFRSFPKYVCKAEKKTKAAVKMASKKQATVRKTVLQNIRSLPY